MLFCALHDPDMVVCQWARKMHVRSSVLCTQPVSRFQPVIIQTLLLLFLPNLCNLIPSYTVSYIPNLKEIAPAVPEIWIPESH